MNKKNRDELGLKCAILILDFNEWTRRYDYIKLMENFLENTIDFKEFETEFLNIWSANCDKEKSWEEFVFIINNFKLNEFDDFSALTSKLFEYIDIVEIDQNFKQDYEITEKELKDRIKIILSKMKNYCH